MSKNDMLRNFIFETMSVRGTVVHLEESFQTITQQHQYPAAIKQMLGEMLIVVSLLSASVKFKGRITIQFQGKKKVRLMMVQRHNDCQLRGLVQWEGDLSEAELLTELKQGNLAIMMDPDAEGGTRYQGIVTWEGESLTESIEKYFQRSEQITTRVWLSVSDKKAAGLLVQMMPAEAVSQGKDPLGDSDWEHVVQLSETVTHGELLDLDSETLLWRLYSQDEVRLFNPIQLMFGCTCSVKRSEAALRLLGQDEIEEELEQNQKIVVTCEFCNREYVFDRIDIAGIFKDGNNSGSSTQIH